MIPNCPFVIPKNIQAFSDKKMPASPAKTLSARIRQLGPKFDATKAWLQGILGTDFRKYVLISWAMEIGGYRNLPPDRAAKRNFECLICWFAENCFDDVEAAVPPASLPASAQNAGSAVTNAFCGFADTNMEEEDDDLWTFGFL
jgi:hypothetical protein